MKLWHRAEKVNKDAHAAWMVKIKVKNPAELKTLLSTADYEKFVAEEAVTEKHCRSSKSNCRGQTHVSS